MRRLTLTRLESSAYATYGQIVDEENRLLCRTLELPWRNNAPRVSCVPAGTYPAHRRYSPKHKYELFELDGVPNRSNIELHVGNLTADSLGCILLGMRFGMLGDKHGILASGEAFRVFMEALRGVDQFTLVITNPPDKLAA